MKITMYVDESGDFETHRGDWVVSAAIFAADHETAEQTLDRYLPQRIGFSSPSQLHLTEIRATSGIEAANDFAQMCLRSIAELENPPRFVAAVNLAKKALSDRESTYRLMLLDLIALADAGFVDLAEPIELTMIIATRTIDGILSTNEADIRRDTTDSLRHTLEVGLASRGLMESFEAGKVSVFLFPANKHWGLAIADVVANLVYNRKYTEVDLLLRPLLATGVLSIFESFGDYDRRRALVAERDGDYHLAIFRWLQKYTDSSDDVSKKIISLCGKMLQNKSGQARTADVEALSERLWRNCKEKPYEYDKLAQQLALLESCIASALESDSSSHKQGLLFRLKNLQIIVCNHAGNVDESERIAQKQQECLDVIAANPENASLVMDFLVYQSEIDINALRLEECLQGAIAYARFVDDYLRCWSLLCPEIPEIQFRNNRSRVRAQMNLARSQLYGGCVFEPRLLVDAEQTFSSIERNAISDHDRSRANALELNILRKNGKLNEALQAICEIRLRAGVLNPYETASIAASLADYALCARPDEPKLLEALDWLEGSSTLPARSHPDDLILRDVAICRFLCRNDNAGALRLLRRSQKALTGIKRYQSPVYHLLTRVVNAHHDFIKGKLGPWQSYTPGLNVVDCSPVRDSMSGDTAILYKIRWASPY